MSECISDTSEEYLALSDRVARATMDRPVAALVEGATKQLELWPFNGGRVVLTTQNLPLHSLMQLDSTSLDDEVPIPPKAHSGFIYYTAYLVLLSYKDSAAAAMREAALRSIGATEK